MSTLSHEREDELNALAAKHGLIITDSFFEVVDWCIRNVTANDTFIDVGANEGWVSLWTMKVVKPRLTVAVEAMPLWADNLVERFRTLTPTDNWRFVCELALDVAGEARDMWAPTVSPSQSSVWNRFGANNDSVKNYRLPTTTIDELIQRFNVDTPIVIKCDAEIADPLVFRGMKKSLPIIRAICMEWYPNAIRIDAKMDPIEVLKEFRETGFRIEDLTGKALTDEEAISGGGKQDIALINEKYGYVV